MDDCAAEDARRRPMGYIYTISAGLWLHQAELYSCLFYTDIRRGAGRILARQREGEQGTLNVEHWTFNSALVYNNVLLENRIEKRLCANTSFLICVKKEQYFERKRRKCLFWAWECHYLCIVKRNKRLSAATLGKERKGKETLREFVQQTTLQSQ